MTPPIAATGLQVAFVYLLMEYLIAIGTTHLIAALHWPMEHFVLLGNLVSIALSLVILLAIRPLRLHFVAELSRPLGREAFPEVALVAIFKTAIAFATLGMAALYLLQTTPEADLHSRLGLAADPESVTRRYFSTHGLIHALFLAPLIGPFAEELIFRGLLYRLWERQWGWMAAMLATSVCFALAHPARMASAFLGSIVYVCVLRRTGTLWGPIACHGLYNALVTWPLMGHLLFARTPESVRDVSGWLPHLACLAFVTFALPYYLHLSRRPREADGRVS